MNKQFVGIDLSKAQLDVALHPQTQQWKLVNDDAGIATLVEYLKKHKPSLIVLEATGGLERPVAEALVKAGFQVAVVNPRQVRHFAKAKGLLAKTDVLDAKVLAQYGEAMKPEARPLPDEQTQQLQDLLARTTTETHRSRNETITARQSHLAQKSRGAAKCARCGTGDECHDAGRVTRARFAVPQAACRPGGSGSLQPR